MAQTSIRKDFLNFVKSPDYIAFDEYTIIHRLIVLFKVFVISSLLQIVPGLILSIFAYFGLYNEIEMISTEIYEFEKSRSSGYIIYLVLHGVLIMPVLEEIIFRFPLKHFEAKSIILALSIGSGLFLMYLISEYLWWPSGNLLFFLTSLIYLILTSGLFYILINQFGEGISKLKYFWNNNSAKIIYCSVTLFALLHIFNLRIEARDLVFLPILLTSFIIHGLAFGYLRIRLGLKYSIVMHILMNGLSFALG